MQNSCENKLDSRWTVARQHLSADDLTPDFQRQNSCKDTLGSQMRNSCKDKLES